jgi:hypothetical protein
MKTSAVAVITVVASVTFSACTPVSQSAKQTPNKTQQQRYPSYQQQMATHAASVPNQHSSGHFPLFGAQQMQQADEMPMLSQAELQVIGDQIFKNEGGGSMDNLVHWNDGEDFASMGIGHFTWYPAGRAARFGNTFPDLLNYMQTKGVNLPPWLMQAKQHGAPWQTKAELMASKASPQVRELQNMLYQTRYLQTQFIVDRTRRATPRIVNATTPELRGRVAQNLNAVANTPGGWYALIDYTNFKGEGLNRNGGYNGQNWGLLQVLEEMRPAQAGQQALNEFADAAYRVLERRVRNSPPARNEARWLAGWSNRVNTYRRVLA